MESSDNDAIIAQHQWWHTIDLGDNKVTPGAWDIRHLPRQIPWPDTLQGKRCLDVGTLDGFWAFEMERRGAGEVIAIDIPVVKRQPGATFRALAQLLGSRAAFQITNIYDLHPAQHGHFDVIFVGYMLHQLRDPLRALEAVRSVCRGSIIVLDQVMYFRSLFDRKPVASIGARPGYTDWFTFNAAGLRRIVELAGFRVGGVSPFLYYHRGPGVKLSDLSIPTILKYTFGGAACSLAVRGDVVR